MKQALRAALDDRGYTTLTPVQTAVLEPEMEGRDLLVSAQTGSGKTLGFGLAIAPALLQDGENFTSAGAPLGLVIAPTRELALQVKRELSWLYAKAGAVLASCVGGMDMRDERRALSRGAHIVVATPGRLRDHVMRGSIDLTNLCSVVLDEADEMLDLGFREDLEFILGETPEDRQTLMFSATVPKAIAALAKSYQKDAVRVTTKTDDTQHADIQYKSYSVADRDAENAVINTLLYHQAPNAIVFGNTRAMVNRLTTRLSNRGFKTVALSGELSQTERTHALQAMRDGRARVCVATDVAARGIDLPNLDLVVHAELPSNHETLLHRSGRTGRAGRKGVSALIVTRKNRRKAERILGMAKVKADWLPAPSAEAVNAREEERMMDDPNWRVPAEASESETVTKLTAQFSEAELATAYLRLYRSVRSSPEELSDIDAKPPQREDFGPSKWFSVTGGRAAGAEPRRLLPLLCEASSLTRNDVGAIRIQSHESFVQIKETSVAAFLQKLGPDMELEPGAKVAQMNEPPRFEKSGRPAPKGNRKPPYKSDTKPNGKKPADAGHDGKPSRPRPEPSKPAAKKPAQENHIPSDVATPKAKPSKTVPAKAEQPKNAQSKPSSPKLDQAMPASKPKQPKAKNDAAPIDWNDTSIPRRRKPKPADRAMTKRTAYKGAKTDAGGSSAPKRSRSDGVGDQAPTRKPKTGPKGPPPPQGKPSSKKNRTRALTAKPKGRAKPPKRS